MFLTTKLKPQNPSDEHFSTFTTDTEEHLHDDISAFSWIIASVIAMAEANNSGETFSLDKKGEQVLNRAAF